MELRFPAPADQTANGAEALLACSYFAIYFGYLFFRLEGELLHWVSLVLLPALLIQLRRGHGNSLQSLLASFGLARGKFRKGIFWAVGIGFALSAAQLVLSRNRGAIAELLASARILYLLPATFLLMVVFAGFTEEFFFRGFLQTRLTARFSATAGIAITSFLFGMYHLPYAYLHPRWPSHGDWGAACGAAFGQGVPIGLFLGILYQRSRGNLPACVVCHALINTLPGMLQIRLGR